MARKRTMSRQLFSVINFIFTNIQESVWSIQGRGRCLYARTFSILTLFWALIITQRDLNQFPLWHFYHFTKIVKKMYDNHFLTDCPLHKDERNSFFKFISILNKTFILLTKKNKYIWLMSNEDRTIITKLNEFLINPFKKKTESFEI